MTTYFQKSVTLIAVFSLAGFFGHVARGEENWTNLLPEDSWSEHWTTKGNWKINDDGVLELTPRPGEKGWARFDAYLWSKKEYTDFEIAFEYKLEPKGNSGFYFHVGDKADPVAKGIEVQLYESHAKGSDARLTDHDSGGIIPGIPPTSNAAKPAGTWNEMIVTCRGNDLTVKLNGKVVNHIELDQPKLKDRPASGSIGFQDHALPLALRNIRIRTLE